MARGVIQSYISYLSQVDDCKNTAGLGKHLKVLTTDHVATENSQVCCKIPNIGRKSRVAHEKGHGKGNVKCFFSQKHPSAHHFKLMIGREIGPGFLLGHILTSLSVGSGWLIFHFHSHRIHNMWYIYLHLPYKSYTNQPFMYVNISSPHGSNDPMGFGSRDGRVHNPVRSWNSCDW